jgi:hypothetical protein
MIAKAHRIAAVSLAALLLALVTGANAATITLTSGFMEFNPFTGGGSPGAGYSLHGPGFDAVGRFQLGSTSPSILLPALAPFTLRGFFVGGDAPGTVTLNGTVFTQVGSAAAVTSLSIEGLGCCGVAPPIVSAVTETIVSVPGQISGAFFTPGETFPFFGDAVGEVTLRLVPPGNLWQPTFARFEVVPEPTSITLVAIGLVAGSAAWWRRKR